MKKSSRLICYILVVALVIAFPVHAANESSSRESAFFTSYATFLHKTSVTSFQVWFDVDSNLATMDVIGVSVIEVYRSSDQQSWKLIKTYRMEDYPDMVDQNTGTHTGYVTFSYATPGQYYTAYVTFYARNSMGVGERYVYTTALRML